MLTLKHKGNFSHIDLFLKNAKKLNKDRIMNLLNECGQEGVSALASATPVDTGNTAGSWGYEISESKGKYTLSWINHNVNSGVNIAIILQYGHATGTGGYVRGYDYINPSLRPIFDKFKDRLRKEVMSK